MDQLCSKLQPEADNGCTDAVGRLPLAGKQIDAENRKYSHSLSVCRLKNAQVGRSGSAGAVRRHFNCIKVNLMTMMMGELCPA